MGAQFVDYDADGRSDLFTATYDGSPHVSLGSEKGFLEPRRVLDAKGERVMLQAFWDYDAEQWSENKAQPKGHCTSAAVFDWDNDGDLALILGSYGDGKLYRQMNEGKKGKPKFTGKNIPIEAGGKPIAVNGGVTAPQLIDWNGDGRTDLVCGGFGGSYGRKPGGAVSLFINTGKLGAPKFAKPRALIAPSPMGATEPTRPDAALYAHAVDYDADGDLDLVVGGRSHWQLPPRDLTAAQEKRAAELRKQLEAMEAEVEKLFEKLDDPQKLFASDEYKKIVDSRRAAKAELEELVPSPQQKYFVWLYRNTSGVRK